MIGKSFRERVLTMFFREEKGNVLVIVAVGMAFLMGITALVVDMGYVYSQRRHLQNTADAAALAGAREMVGGNDVVGYVEQYVQANDVALAEIVGIENENSEVTVKLAGERDLFFARAIGFDSLKIGVQATAAAGIIASGKGVMPFGISEERYKAILDGNADSHQTLIDFHIPDYGAGNWGWLYLEENENADETVDFVEEGYPKTIEIGSDIHSNTGANVPGGHRKVRLENILDGYIANEDVLFIPITKLVKENASGKNDLKVVGFAHMILTDYDISNSSSQELSGRIVTDSLGKGNIIPGTGGEFDLKGIALIK